MADIYMHSRLCEDVIKSLKNNIDIDIAFLGAQGPDPLYYLMFDKNFSTYKDYADNMHRYDTREALINMVNFVKENNNRNTYSFLTGFIAHYALDVKIHPFVYYNVGIYDKDNPKTHSWRGLHLKFERSIDALLIQKELQIPSRKMNLTKKYYPVKHSNEDINNLMANTYKFVFDIDTGATLYKSAVLAMYNSVKYIVTDRFGIKKQIYKLVNVLYKDHDMMISDLSMFNHLEKFDYHNDQKSTWHHPVTNESYNYSVMELYDQAKVFALDMMTKVNQYIFENKDIDLGAVFKNLSYNSGIDCDHSHPFQYFNIYRK